MSRLLRAYGRAYATEYRWCLAHAPLSWLFSAVFWPGSAAYLSAAVVRADLGAPM